LEKDRNTMIGHPGAKSKPGICVRRTSRAHGALLDGQDKSIKLPMLATNNLLPD
jgi:hypothetical protein